MGAYLSEAGNSKSSDVSSLSLRNRALGKNIISESLHIDRPPQGKEGATHCTESGISTPAREVSLWPSRFRDLSRCKSTVTTAGTRGSVDKGKGVFSLRGSDVVKGPGRYLRNTSKNREVDASANRQGAGPCALQGCSCSRASRYSVARACEGEANDPTRREDYLEKLGTRCSTGPCWWAMTEY